ncbi:hypothetical protein [Streptomyces sp. NPDC001714]|uniref:hypothetical protein n=1 Tax=Streptomyces sp. NPDC001714 TaxID=3364603 RepID=UPI003694CA72
MYGHKTETITTVLAAGEGQVGAGERGNPVRAGLTGLLQCGCGACIRHPHSGAIYRFCAL